MRIIPDTPHRTNSRAEKRVFDRLRMAFPTSDEESFTAFHSLNLPRHAYKRFAEIDFLICCQYGIFVLEVKGGGVACRDGVWEYTNREGQVSRSNEGPFKQAETALHGVMAKMRECLPARVVNQFSIGYGVVFPDCEWRSTGAEWDRQIVADTRSFKDLEGWLNTLFSYWRLQDGGKRFAAPEIVKEACRYFRPQFESATPLHVRVDATAEMVASLTEDQMLLIDVVSANPRVLCSGGAGTGKTFLAMELARRWTAEGFQVALICRSPWLKSYLQARLAIPGLTVCLVSAIVTTLKRQQLATFDAVIVDEGQDLMDTMTLDALDRAVAGGLAEGRWCFFHDVNNQSGFFGTPQQEAIDCLNSFNPTRVPLKTNCRNTRVILDKIHTLLGADMGTRGAGDGPQVWTHTAHSKEEAARILAAELDKLIHDGGLTCGQVTILSGTALADSAVPLLPGRLKQSIERLDEHSLIHFPGDRTGFAEIANFKGLENDAIVMIGLPPLSKRPERLAEHYVGMSRARAVLSVIYEAPQSTTGHLTGRL
ncbi:nuclease [Halorhodospira abdelmalekii]|uniref:nuclease-related domain-containing DEAD/DEAH box helicase n=1 Tax=Halorhodospira abdelmalekii TaxID=421629 RepID=UPI00190587E9|nr:NERD domain-containing protein/DEAD/DEAH box helicase [Halorhodospira abdelmalekii]MBK1735378.1 nuclease [Halorhodospira abdelmalekii]